MSERLPLTEVSGDEVIARVAYQIILADYRENPLSYDDPVPALLDLAVKWDADDLSYLHEQLTLAALWVANGGTIATWLRARCFAHTSRASKLIRVGRGPRR